MKNKNFGFLNVGVLPLSLIAIVTVVASGCLGDKDEQDFRNDQANQYEAQIQAVVGTYKGTVTSSNGALLGEISLNVASTPIAQKSSDNLTDETAADVSGYVSYSGLSNTQSLNYDGASYDPSSGLLTISNVTVSGASMPSTTGGAAQPVSLYIQGTISNGSISGGTIQVKGYPSLSGTLNLSLAGASAPPASQLDAKILSNPRLKALGFNQQQIFSGPFQSTHESGTVTIGLTNTDTNEQQFVDIFSGVRSVTVSYDEDLGKDSSGNEVYNTYPPASGTIDDVNRTLTANFNNAGYIMVLSCTGNQDASGVVSAWTCNKTAGGITTGPMVLAAQSSQPVASAQTQSK